MQRLLKSHLAIGIVLLLTAGTFLGCSPEKRDKVLRFFFDGVPERTASGTKSTAAMSGPTRYVHKPYAEQKCDSCHPASDLQLEIGMASNVTPLESSVCLKCHGNIPNEKPVMHGPVAAAECLMCHAPHESGVAHLLRLRSPRLCMQCHAAGTTLSTRPEHHDDKADCLECHVGHGSTKHGLLKPAPASATQPAAPLANSPSGPEVKGAGL